MARSICSRLRNKIKPLKKIKLDGDRKSTQKRIQNNDSKDDPRPQKKNESTDGEDTKMVKELNYIKNNQLNNIVTEMKSKLEGINSVNEVEQQVRELEGRVLKVTVAHHNKEKEQEEMSTYGTMLNTLMFTL